VGRVVTRGGCRACFAAVGGSLEDGRHHFASDVEHLGLQVGDQGGVGEVVAEKTVDDLGADLGKPGRDPAQHGEHIIAQASVVGDLTGEHRAVAAQGGDHELGLAGPPASQHGPAPAGPLRDALHGERGLIQRNGQWR